MISVCRTVFTGAVLGVLVACGGGGSTSTSVPSVTAPPAATATSSTLSAYPLQGAITTHSIDSKMTGATYPINVYTPSNYVAGSAALPVIYATDGGNDAYPGFQTMATILEQQGIRAIMIGIGNFARRDIDYRLPGANNYYIFLTIELIPFIEKLYSIDSKNRTLTGHSYGGLFSFLAMTLDIPSNGYFRNFIALDGSFWHQTDLLNAMENQMFVTSVGKLPNTTLVLSSASDRTGNDPFVEATYQRLLGRNYQGLTLQRIPTYAMGHMEMFGPGFRDSVRLVFGK